MITHDRDVPVEPNDVWYLYGFLWGIAGMPIPDDVGDDPTLWTYQYQAQLNAYWDGLDDAENDEN
jgi:hypothetical protein